MGPPVHLKVHPISHPDDLLSTHGEVGVNHLGWVAQRTAFLRFRDLIIYTPFFNANLTDPAPVFAFQLPTMGHIGAKKCYSARWALQCRALVGSGEVTRYTFGDPRQAAPGQLVITGPSAAVQYSCFIAYFERLQIAVVSTPVPLSASATSWSWISRAAQTCRW